MWKIKIEVPRKYFFLSRTILPHVFTIVLNGKCSFQLVIQFDGQNINPCFPCLVEFPNILQKLTFLKQKLGKIFAINCFCKNPMGKIFPFRILQMDSCLDEAQNYHPIRSVLSGWIRFHIQNTVLRSRIFLDPDWYRLDGSNYGSTKCIPVWSLSEGLINNPELGSVNGSGVLCGPN